MFKTAEVLWKLLSGQRLGMFEDCSRKSLYFIDYITSEIQMLDLGRWLS